MENYRLEVRSKFNNSRVHLLDSSGESKASVSVGMERSTPAPKSIASCSRSSCENDSLDSLSLMRRDSKRRYLSD